MRKGTCIGLTILFFFIFFLFNSNMNYSAEVSGGNNEIQTDTTENGSPSAVDKPPYEEVLNIELSAEDNVLNYYHKDKMNKEHIISKTGVESFAVDKQGKIYLSNYAVGKVLIYHNNKYIDGVDISQYYQPRDIQIKGDSLYILEDNSRIIETSTVMEEDINKEDKIVEDVEFKIPVFPVNEDNNLRPLALKILNDYTTDKIAVLYDNNMILYFKDSGIKNLILNKYRIKSSDGQVLEGKVYKRIVGFDDNDNIYISGLELKQSSDQLGLKEYIYKFNSKGNLLASAETVDEKNYITPFRYLDVNRTGQVHQLLVLEDRVRVYKLNFTKYLKDSAESITMSDNDNTVNEESGVIVTTEGNTESNESTGEDGNIESEGRVESEGSVESGGNTQGTESSDAETQKQDQDEVVRNALRDSLYYKAVKLADFKWTYNPDKNNTDQDNVAVPYYLRNITEEKELTGIPYCWGGFDSLDTKSSNQKWENFPDAVKKGAITGNAGITSNYIPGTTGLDCSGFISVVLGLRTREPSWKFYYKNNIVENIKYKQLDTMDILVKNGHMLFYINQNDYGIRSIETNIMGSEWKVKRFSWSWRALRDMGYRARRYKKLSED